MYSQSVRVSSQRNRGWKQPAVKRRQLQRERRRLFQLGICLVLFLTVFIGKGVFPQKIQQVSDQLLEIIGRDTDFRATFSKLGESLAEEKSFLGELGNFCIEVFGPEDKGESSIIMYDTTLREKEQDFLNSAPKQASLEAHYLRGEQVLKNLDTQEEQQDSAEQSGGCQEAEETDAVPAVGTVIMSADYQGMELPQGYTMDQLSLGGLETITPLYGTLRSQYGYRDHPIDGEYKFHNGVDIGAETGESIGAFADGTVEYIGQSDVYGNYFQIDHGNGIKSFYAHCSQLLVSQGQEVKAGECVALVGATGNVTGPHLHFEIKCAGMHVDPAYYIQYKLE